MARLVDAARAAGIPHVASADDHELTDDEISDAARLPRDVSAALPARHPRRRARSTRPQQEEPVPLALTAVPGALAPGTRVPAAEEALRRVHQPERRPAARPARPGGGRALRGRDRRLRRRGDPGPPRPRSRASRSSRRPRAASTPSGLPPASTPGGARASASPRSTRYSPTFRSRLPLPMSPGMALAFNFGSYARDFALTWLPVLFFGLMCVVVYLLWKTVRLMPRVKPHEITPGSDSSVTWSDVAGLDEAKEELQEIVDFLRDPKRFERLGARVPKGILFHGPPGTGKTLAAKAVANESGARFYAQSASAFVEMFAGLGAARIRKLFDDARKNAPVDRLHRRARRRRAGAQRPLVQPRAGSDAQPAARRARRLRPARPGRRDGRVEPAPGPRPGAAPPRSLRPPDPDPAARPPGPHRDPRRPHAREAARAGCRAREHRAPDLGAHGRRPREHLQRGGDRRGTEGLARRSRPPTSSTRSSASSPDCSSGASSPTRRSASSPTTRAATR